MISRQAKKGWFIKFNTGFGGCFCAIFSPWTHSLEKKHLMGGKNAKLLLYIMSRIKVTQAGFIKIGFKQKGILFLKHFEYELHCKLHRAHLKFHIDPFTLTTLHLTLCALQTPSCVLQHAFCGKGSSQA